MDKTIYLVGLSYRTAGVDIRERYALTDHCSPEDWIVPMRSCDQDDSKSDETCIEESLILSTCNRVEILAVGRGNVPEALHTCWARACGRPASELQRYTYIYKDKEAIEHLFLVASSLDSMVLGEPQILGQLKSAYRKAVIANATGCIINKLTHKAFFVAKRVRTETEVSSSAVSISYAAVELAKKIFGDMNGYHAMLIGAGEMAELAATHLLQAGITTLTVTNRTFSRAQDLAMHFHGDAVPFEQLFNVLDDMDIVISSTGSPDAIIRTKEVRRALLKRKNKPMFFIDIAVPRDIDPDVNNLDNVYLYDIDDLKEVVEENWSHRRSEASKAHVLVDTEVKEAVRWLNSLPLQPVIVDLLRHLDGIADEELAKTLRRLNPVDDSTREALSLMLHAFVRKISHTPLLYLKQAHETGDIRTLRLVRELFNLDNIPRSRRCRYRIQPSAMGLPHEDVYEHNNDCDPSD